MLVRNFLSKQIAIPGEDGQWMQFRRLNDRRLNECADKRQMDSMKRMVNLGMDAMAMIRAAQADRKDQQESKADPLDAYDRGLLLRYGIAAWSYDAKPEEELEAEDGGLDVETSKWAALQILEFNGLLPEAAETARGN